MDAQHTSWIGPLRTGGQAPSSLSYRELDQAAIDENTHDHTRIVEQEDGLARTLEITCRRELVCGHPISGEPHREGSRRRVGSAAIVGVLLLGVLGIGVVFWPKEAAEPAPRLLESDELVDTVVKHTILFHEQLGVSADEFGVTQQELENHMTESVRQHVRELMQTLVEQNPDDAKAFREFRVSKEHWEKVHAVLTAVHDDRVRALGVDVMKDDPAMLAKHMESRQATIRKLSHELLPKGAQPTTASPWHMFIGSHGEMGAKAQFGDWKAGFQVDTESRRLLAASPATPPASPPAPPPLAPPAPAPTAPPAPPPYFAPPALAPVAAPANGGFLLGKFLFNLIGTSLAGIFAIVFAIVTAVEHTMKPVTARVLWILQTSLASVTCGADLGLSLGIPGWQGIVTWIPCMIMAAFSGLEAIWTFWT